MKLYSIPYYIDLEGQEINGVKINQAHVKLFGAIIIHDRMGNGCFADTKTLAEEIKVTEKTLMNTRSDLIRSGLVIAERRKDTKEIEKLTIPDVVFLTLNNRGIPSTDGIDSIHRWKPIPSTDGMDNREATPVLNKILNKNIKTPSSADASSDASPKEKTSPFDEKPIIDVRKKSNVDSANVKSRRAFAIAGKVYKLMGLDAKPGVKMRNRIASRIDEGYTEDDIVGCIAWCEKDDYYKNSKDPMSWTSEDAMTKFKLEQNHKEEVNKKLNSKMEFKDTW